MKLVFRYMKMSKKASNPLPIGIRPVPPPGPPTLISKKLSYEEIEKFKAAWYAGYKGLSIYVRS